MRPTLLFALLTPLALLLVACEPDGGDPGPGPVDPFDEVAAEMAACVEIEDRAEGPDGLRIASVSQLGPLRAGERTQLRITLAEVTGRAFGDYPSVSVTSLDGDIELIDLGAAPWFAIFGCQTYTTDVTIEAAPGARGEAVVEVGASTLGCNRDGGCRGLHSVDVVLPIE